MLKGDQGPSLEETRSLVTGVALAAHAYGATAARLQTMLTRVTDALGYRGSFRSTPTEIMFALGVRDEAPVLRLLDTPAAGMDLDKLADLGALVDDVVAGDVTPRAAEARLEALAKKPPPWGPVSTALSYPVIGAGVVALLSGSWPDAALASVLSVLVWAMTVASARWGARAADWLPLTTAAAAAGSATAATAMVPELNVLLVTLASVAVLLPGYTVSLGTGEIATGNVVSGTANLTSGLVCLAKQVAGGWIGMAAVGAFVPARTATAQVIEPAWLWLFVPTLAAGLCVVFQTAKRDMWGATVSCVIGYLGIVGGSSLSSVDFGNLLGTVLVTAFANLWSARTKRPATIVLLPAIVFLVSGTIGFRGLSAIVTGQTETGGQQFTQMFVVALTITLGLLLGNALFGRKT